MIIAKYSLNGNANDSAGSNNGVSTNVSWVAGKSNLAGSFNGSSSYITMGNNQIITNNYTIYGQVKINSSGNFERLIGKYNGGDNNTGRGFYHQVTSSGRLQSLHNSTGSQFRQESENIIDYGKYNTIGIIYNGTSFIFYINGINAGNTGNIGVNQIYGTNSNEFQIGRIFVGGGQTYFNGLIDEIEIHNIIQTPAEAKNKHLYLNGFI